MTTLREWINIVESQGITDEWFKDDSFKVFKRPTKERYRIATEPGTIDTLEGPIKYPKGHYIMTGPKGEEYPISPERFRDLKDDLGDGVAQPKKIIKLAKVADHSGTVDTSWGEKMHYNPKDDVLVRHGENDYGVVKQDIFDITYERV
jgi:hypothetical protein